MTDNDENAKYDDGCGTLSPSGPFYWTDCQIGRFQPGRRLQTLRTVGGLPEEQLAGLPMLYLAALNRNDRMSIAWVHQSRGIDAAEHQLGAVPSERRIEQDNRSFTAPLELLVKIAEAYHEKPRPSGVSMFLWMTKAAHADTATYGKPSFEIQLNPQWSFSTTVSEVTSIEYRASALRVKGHTIHAFATGLHQITVQGDALLVHFLQRCWLLGKRNGARS